jgi:hypothetical protein
LRTFTAQLAKFKRRHREEAQACGRPSAPPIARTPPAAKATTARQFFQLPTCPQAFDDCVTRKA